MKVIVAAVVAIAIIAFSLYWQRSRYMARMRASTQLVQAKGQLQKIWWAIGQYRQKHNNDYPDNLENLIPEYLDEMDIRDKRVGFDESRQMFLYAKPVVKSEHAAVPVVIDKPDNHSMCGWGMCALFSDGRIVFIEGQDKEVFLSKWSNHFCIR